MLKKTIKYKDFNDVEREEDFYFHLSEAELTEMEMTTTGGLAETIQRIVAAQDPQAIVEIFKKIVLKAYGRKTPDGKYLMKDDQIRKEFECSPVYSIIFMELATDADKAADFINGVVPANMSQQAKKATHPAIK